MDADALQKHKDKIALEQEKKRIAQLALEANAKKKVGKKVSRIKKRSPGKKEQGRAPILDVAKTSKDEESGEQSLDIYPYLLSKSMAEYLNKI